MVKSRALITVKERFLLLTIFLFFKVLRNLNFLENVSWSCADTFGQKSNLLKIMRVRNYLLSVSPSVSSELRKDVRKTPLDTLWFSFDVPFC